MDETALTALRASGWIALLALVGAIAASPIARLAPRASARLAQARRRLGIAGATLALGHAGLASIVYLEPRALAGAAAAIAWLRSGALALALLVPLLVTSFPAPTRLLRVRAWKPLHRLAYAAVALALHHVLLGPFAPRSWAVAVAVLVAILLLARLVPRRRDRGPGRDGTVAEPGVES